MHKTSARLILGLAALATLVVHLRFEPTTPRKFDPYQKSDAILRMRGFEPSNNELSSGLTAKLVHYSSQHCPEGLNLVALSYDQLMTYLGRISNVPGEAYLVIGSQEQERSPSRLSMFRKELNCRMRDKFGTNDSTCSEYLVIVSPYRCVQPADWQSFWHKL